MTLDELRGRLARGRITPGLRIVKIESALLSKHSVGEFTANAFVIIDDVIRNELLSFIDGTGR